MPLGRLISLLEPTEILIPKSKVLQSHLDIVSIQNPHHHRLTMTGWDDANPHVDVFARNQDLDPAVLRPALLGDIDETHDLDAAYDRAEQSAGRVVTLHQNTVNPVSNPNPIRKWLDVDIARPHRHGFLDDQVHELDDRRVAFFQSISRRRLTARRSILGKVDRRVREFLEHRVHRLRLRRRAPVILVDRLHDRFLRRQRDLDLAIEHEPQLVDRLEIERIVHDNTNGATLLRERHHNVLPGQRLRNQLDHRGGYFDLSQLDKRKAVLLGLRFHDVVRAGIAQLDQRLLDRRAIHPLRFLELIRPDDTSPYQDFGPIASLRHGSTLSRVVFASPPEMEPAEPGAPSQGHRPERRLSVPWG